MSGNGRAPGLHCEAPGHWSLLGDITQSTVPGVHHEAGRQAVAASGLVLDLSSVERIDSAALALLLSIARRVRASGGTLEIRGAPPALVALAGVSGVAGLLGLAPV